ncbi:FAD-dependent oxidoreductase [Psychrobacter jeotgali]|uniref:FAD-dependent oxidoreductase n=1 Tax=Psychrobacter jeotgali TaxID=179010 RepID=UPI00191A26DC|nr:FAD-dependent oxidoreductase [Psychrobacter jeotgali]
MAHIAVLGAGVVGITTAWYLRQAGFDVTVIERESAAGIQTLFASGSLSVANAKPWADPKTPFEALKGFFSEDAPLLYRLRADKSQRQWAMQFLRECRAEKSDANLVQMVRLGLYSQQALKYLRADMNIKYEHKTRGVMHFYTNKVDFEAANAATKRIQELGCNRQFIDINNTASLEPALYPIAHKLIGATYTSLDESGNPYLFTKRLAERCQQAGVRFMYDTEVLALNVDAHSEQPHIHSITIQPIDENAQTFSADSHVLALGHDSMPLLKPLEVELPIFAAKSYTATYKVNPRAPHLAPFISLIDDEYKLVISRLGDTLRVASAIEFNGYSLDLNQARCDEITERIRQLFPKGIVANSAQFWASLHPMTPSSVPLIGRAHKGRNYHGSHNTEATFDNLWLNTGHGTLGWTFACGSAKAISLMMQGETPKVDFDFVGSET